MSEEEGRAPRPRGGDPNLKSIRVTLTPHEWRKLRVWAAEEDLDMQQIVSLLLRRALEKRPGRTY